MYKGISKVNFEFELCNKVHNIRYANELYYSL